MKTMRSTRAAILRMAKRLRLPNRLGSRGIAPEYANRWKLPPKDVRRCWTDRTTLPLHFGPRCAMSDLGPAAPSPSGRHEGSQSLQTEGISTQIYTRTQ